MKRVAHSFESCAKVLVYRDRPAVHDLTHPPDGAPMSHAARSIQIYGVYLLITGVSMTVVPNMMLGSLGIPPTGEGYIRMLGLVLGILGLYYLAAARADVIPFFRWTVWGRAIAVIGVIALISLGIAPAAFLGTAALDAASAIWTAIALRTVAVAAA